MVESFELDVVAMIHSKIVLVECKDTSFGQNDFVNLSAKAEEIDADVIGVVTTQPLHENVKGLIERRKRDAERSVFVIEDVQEPDRIRSGIQNEVENLKRDYIQEILHGDDPYVSRYGALYRRRRPRRVF